MGVSTLLDLKDGLLCIRKMAVSLATGGHSLSLIILILSFQTRSVKMTSSPFMRVYLHDYFFQQLACDQWRLEEVAGVEQKMKPELSGSFLKLQNLFQNPAEIHTCARN